MLFFLPVRSFIHISNSQILLSPIRTFLHPIRTGTKSLIPELSLLLLSASKEKTKRELVIHIVCVMSSVCLSKSEAEQEKTSTIDAVSCGRAHYKILILHCCFFRLPSYLPCKKSTSAADSQSFIRWTAHHGRGE